MRPNDLSNHLSNPNETTTGTLVKNTLKHFCVFAFFLCLPFQIASANDAPLQIFTFGEGIRFDKELNLDTGLGFGAGLNWSTRALTIWKGRHRKNAKTQKCLSVFFTKVP
ncbi:MAG: hypothetical protein AAFP70_10815, partial [Calditrichota bacterium]